MLTSTNRFKTKNEARVAVFRYIEGSYYPIEGTRPWVRKARQLEKILEGNPAHKAATECYIETTALLLDRRAEYCPWPVTTI